MKKSNNIEYSDKDDKSELTKRMIALLFSGEQLTEEERDGICRYLSDEKNASHNEEALFLYFSSRSNSDLPIGKSVFADEMWPEIAEALGMNPDLDHYRAIRAARARVSAGTLRRPMWRRVMVRVAAVLLPIVLVVGGYFGWEAIRSGSGSGSQGDRASITAFVATNSIETQADVIRMITLSDGTEVTLNRNSTLSYNDDREAELVGEAYFKVAPNPRHPFIIHSGHLKVTVLGTEFNFQTLKDAGDSKLSLYEGSVQLDYSSGSYRIEEGGHEFTLDHATAQTDIRDFDITKKPQWLEEEQEPLLDIIGLNEIFDLIETRYGVSIINRGAIDLSRRFNFMLDDATTINDVMQALQFASGDFDYTIDGKTITLEKK